MYGRRGCRRGCSMARLMYGSGQRPVRGRFARGGGASGKALRSGHHRPHAEIRQPPEAVQGPVRRTARAQRKVKLQPGGQAVRRRGGNRISGTGDQPQTRDARCKNSAGPGSDQDRRARGWGFQLRVRLLAQHPEDDGVASRPGGQRNSSDARAVDRSRVVAPSTAITMSGPRSPFRREFR